MPSSLLSSHLEQISLCASSIGSLQFPGPRPFTNAVLARPEITTLIRDTEPHERALFSIAPPPIPSKTQVHQFSSTISDSVNSNQPKPVLPPAAVRPPRRNTAVAAVLGGDTYRRIRNGYAAEHSTKYDRSLPRDKQELDVDLLLNAAEKLSSVYPIPGALDRIARMRSRHAQLAANIAHYEDQITTQTSQLDNMYQPKDYSEPQEIEDEEDMHDDFAPKQSSHFMSAEDMRQEEDEIRALERKRRALEERVSGMEKDIGGLMR
ncbi:hypothetical protein AAFC00_005306 [Neodothiora populina]|uniref:DASH complex subunit SPC34 n=1 Tax=Neodothiora populina TaxID=2781224 RepID=A0ABR3PKG5_9PEZI